MLFNSIQFLFFLPVVFILHWFVFNKNYKNQNTLILFSSYVFYGWWDYRFLSLIFLSTIVDYIIGLKISKSDTHKKEKLFLLISIFFNLGVLGFFKYYNFFVDSWVNLFRSIGYEINNVWTLNIILPVGISFYTFQTMSYTIDIYRKKLKPTSDFLSFATFVSFFPQLVAGPIERASNLLPQILIKRGFKNEQGLQGLRLILWGMFKKIVIADSLAPIVDDIFINYQDLSGGILFIGAIYFAFQIYCDFSGYSDIAIGTSKLFGIELTTNFRFPYFSRNIGEFWRRWHISLSTWFRDYLYIPLGGSREGLLKSVRNIFIIFIVSGFWHGANFTFISWGLFHSFLFIPSFIFNTNRKFTSSLIPENKFFFSSLELLQIFKTFLLTTIGWIFFRSNSVYDSINFIIKIFKDFSFDIHLNPTNNVSSFFYLNFLLFFLILEYFQLKIKIRSYLLNFIINLIIILFILFLTNSSVSEKFIYFAF